MCVYILIYTCLSDTLFLNCCISHIILRVISVLNSFVQLLLFCYIYTPFGVVFIYSLLGIFFRAKSFVIIIIIIISIHLFKFSSVIVMLEIKRQQDFLYTRKKCVCVCVWLLNYYLKQFKMLISRR